MYFVVRCIIFTFLVGVTDCNPKDSIANAGFYVGRISEGQYEYSSLNGWMTPRTAQDVCETDQQCGGFTYKVPDNVTSLLYVFIPRVRRSRTGR